MTVFDPDKMTAEPHISATAKESIKAGVTRVPVFEGIRAYLAWWVVGYHVLAECGFESRFLPGFLKVVSGGGGAAVNMFVILSGFVITHLLVTRRENYRTFITRRFFRLYPAFITAAAIGLIFLPQKTLLYNYLSTHIYPGVEPLGGSWPSYTTHYWGYLLASLTMLHGALPQTWLPHAQAAFISPGWSISLEWQFYLVIPFLIAGFRRFPLLTLVGIAALSAVSYSWPIGDWGSFLPHQAPYFFIGCVSYFVYLNLPRTPLGGPLPLTVWVAVLLCMVSPDWRAFLSWSYDFEIGAWLPLGLWMLVMAIALDDRAAVAGRGAKLISFLFTNRVAQWLGMVSFSTYLFHYFALFLGLSAFQSLGLAPEKYNALVVALPVTIILTLIFSFMMHYLIEKPGMALGQRLVKKST